MWQLDLEEPRIELGVSQNDFNTYVILNGTLSTWRSSIAFKALSNEGDLQQSVSLTAEYDLDEALYALTEFVVIDKEGSNSILNQYSAK